MIFEKEYSVVKLRKMDLLNLMRVCKILYLCGKDMAQKYNLQHWNNSYLKNWIIVIICTLKNDIYLVKKEDVSIATFQLKKNRKNLYFQKLATAPQYMKGGVGSFCLKEMEKIAKKLGCKYIACEVYDKSEHAINFYKNNGYVVYGNLKTLKYSELKMRKSLER